MTICAILEGCTALETIRFGDIKDHRVLQKGQSLTILTLKVACLLELGHPFPMKKYLFL